MFVRSYTGAQRRWQASFSEMLDSPRRFECMHGGTDPDSLLSCRWLSFFLPDHVGRHGNLRASFHWAEWDIEHKGINYISPFCVTCWNPIHVCSELPFTADILLEILSVSYWIHLGFCLLNVVRKCLSNLLILLLCNLFPFLMCYHHSFCISSWIGGFLLKQTDILLDFLISCTMGWCVSLSSE